MTSGPAPLHPADLSEALTAFALGLQRAATHPDGHPVLDGAAAELEGRLAALLVGRPSLTIGVAPQQLLVDGIATDPNQPVLRELAARLHAHALGGVMVTRGVTAPELAHLLGLLATDAAALPAPLGTEGPELLAQWPAIRLFPVATAVAPVLEEGEAVVPAAGPAGASVTRGATLWLGLARTAVPRDDAKRLESADDAGADPVAVAAAIESKGADTTYDQSVVGYLAQGIEALATARDVSSDLLRRRLSTLLVTLGDAALIRLVAAHGDRGARRRLLEQAVAALPAAPLRRLLAAVAATGPESVSPALLRLLDGFVRHAERPDVASRTAADIALRETVLALGRAWPPLDGADPGHRARQEGLRRQRAVHRAVEVPFAVEPDRRFAIALETGVLNAAVWRHLETLARAADPQGLLGQLEAAPAGMVRDALWAALATPERLREWVMRTPVPVDAVGALVARLGRAAVPVLLDALEERAEGSGALFAGWLAGLGDVAVPAVTERLVGADPAVRPHLLAALPVALTETAS